MHLSNNTIKVLTFDCYGTLINWDRGIREFFKSILPDKNQKIIEEIITRWETIQFQLVRGKYLPYEELQNKSFEQAFSKFNLSIQANLGKMLLGKIPYWNPFPDVFPILSKLQNHYKLVLISNGPLSLLKKNAQKMAIDFGGIISAELVHAYKPNPKVFDYALKHLNTTTSEVIHIAAGYKYDVIPANNLGIKTIWVNRKKIHRPGKIFPNFEMTDLTSLHKILISQTSYWKSPSNPTNQLNYS